MSSTATATSQDKDDNAEKQLHVVVVVLGDVGRSPRMQYHALSLLEAGHYVSLVGYDGEDLIPDLAVAAASKNRLAVVRFSVPAPKFLQKIRLLYFIWRICSLSLWLMHALLFRVPKTTVRCVDCVLVQNPPALPTLLVAYMYCRIQGFISDKRPGFLIDWHNLGYSMFDAGGGSMIPKVAKIYEKAVAPLADAHLTVTHAMKNLLEREILSSRKSSSSAADSDAADADAAPMIHVVADCPPSMFQPRSLEEQHAILIKLDDALKAACPRQWWSPATTSSSSSSRSDGIILSSQTLFTECCDSDGGKKKYYRPRRGRPALVTSSTSWTSDEDFGILLAALLLLDEQIIQKQESSCSSSLKVLVIVTGKGPQKSMYEEKISRLTLQHVAVATLWLQPGDYPLLIACADLGVSLHTSTSGFDLPMKVLDMFGCQVPVCAKDFACLSELVQDDVNGRIFNNSQQLANLLWELLEPMTTTTTTTTTDNGAGGPASHSFGLLARYSSALEGRERWSNNWLRHAQPVILKTAKTHMSKT